MTPLEEVLFQLDHMMDQYEERQHDVSFRLQLSALIAKRNALIDNETS